MLPKPDALRILKSVRPVIFSHCALCPAALQRLYDYKQVNGSGLAFTADFGLTAVSSFSRGCGGLDKRPEEPVPEGEALHAKRPAAICW